MASVRRKSSNSWQATIYAGYGPDGKQIKLYRTIKVNPESTEAAQRKQATRAANTLETDYQRHLITEAKKIRLVDVAEEFLATKPMAESTKAGYRAMLDRRVKEKLGNIFVQDLTSKHIRDFYKYLEKDPARPAHKVSKDPKKPTPKTRSKTGFLSGTTRKHYHQFLSAVLNFAVKAGYIVVSPMNGVLPPRQDTSEAKFLRKEDIAQLMDVLDNYSSPLWRAFFTLNLYTSCRPGEIIALNWTDLEIIPIEGTDESSYILTIRAGSNHIKGKGTVRTDQPKTNSSKRKILLQPEAYKPLMRWKAEQAKQRLKCGDGWEEPDAMFTNEVGRRLYISSPTHKWREIQQKYQLRDVPLYSFRHTGASLLISRKLDPKEVSGHMGHSRTSTTLDTYAHLFDEAQQITSDTMGLAIAEARQKAR